MGDVMRTTKTEDVMSETREAAQRVAEQETERFREVAQHQTRKGLEEYGCTLAESELSLEQLGRYFEEEAFDVWAYGREIARRGSHLEAELERVRGELERAQALRKRERAEWRKERADWVEEVSQRADEVGQWSKRAIEAERALELRRETVQSAPEVADMTPPPEPPTQHAAELLGAVRDLQERVAELEREQTYDPTVAPDTPFEPDWASPPGDTIRDLLPSGEAHESNSQALARLTGWPIEQAHLEGPEGR